MLLEGVFDRGQLDAAAAAGFELVVHTAEQIELAARRRGAGASRFKMWLKLDSGMNRLGFKGAAFDAALSALSALPRVQSPVNLFTHLASADDPGARPRPPSSSRASRAATASLPGERSIANSAGMLGFPEAQADWVRPGLLLYGVSPFGGSIGADYGLRPVDDAAFARDRAQGPRAGRARGLRRRLDGQPAHAPGGGRGRLRRRLSAQPGLGLAGAGQRRTSAARGPRLDGHDRHRRHRSQARRRSWAIR